MVENRCPRRWFPLQTRSRRSIPQTLVCSSFLNKKKHTLLSATVFPGLEKLVSSVLAFFFSFLFSRSLLWGCFLLRLFYCNEEKSPEGISLPLQARHNQTSDGFLDGPGHRAKPSFSCFPALWPRRRRSHTTAALLGLSFLLVVDGSSDGGKLWRLYSGFFFCEKQLLQHLIFL